MLKLIKQYRWLISGLFLLGLLLGLISFPSYLLLKPYLSSSVRAITGRSLLLPPTESLTGQVATVSGLVRVQVRENEADQTVEINRVLVDGETLITSPSAILTVNFNQVFQVTLGENSQLSLSNLIKDSLVVQQRAGESIYHTAANQQLAIRVGRLLVLLDSGEAKITQTDDIAAIQVIAGQAKIGFVDKSNQTQAYEVKAGQTAEFNLAKRSLEIL
jgi:hypothetical protein